MGVFRIDCQVVNLSDPNRSIVVPQLLVDTGSELSWLPETALLRVGVYVAKKDLLFVIANGQTIARSTGYAILRASGFETVDEVVFGEPGDLFLLGARTLEGFGAGADPTNRRLVAAGPHPAAQSMRGPLPGSSGVASLGSCPVRAQTGTVGVLPRSGCLRSQGVALG
jgi:hypothetical protein